MTGRLAILAGAGAICFAQCNATILFYDGCPIDSSKGYKVDTALNASPNTTPSNDKIKGFSENWNGGTGVLKAYNTSLAFPNSFSATQTANRGDGKFGLVNAGTDKNRPRVQVRKLQNALTAANLSGESAFYFRAMLATSQAALGTLTPEEGLTEKNSRGVGVLHYDKPTYAGHHSSDSSSAYYLLMPTLSKRFVWLGINCHEEGKGALECSIKGSDGEVKTATLIDAVEADATYIACAKLEISADGKEIVTAFAQPVAGYNRSADWVQVGEADLIDYSENSLNCVVFGGNYQTQNGAVYFDEFCGATTLEEAVDWSAGAEPYVSMATFEGNPAEGLAVSVTLANAPESATVRCYAGDTAASVADSAEAVVTWTDESGPTWRYEFPAATWGLTYYARFTIEYGGGGGTTLSTSVDPYTASATLQWQGGSGAWNDADNWSPAAVPSALLGTAFAGGTATVDTDGGEIAAGSLDISGGAKVTLDMTDGTRAAIGKATIVNGAQNNFTVEGGKFAVEGVLTVGNGDATGNNNSSVTFNGSEVEIGALSLVGNTYSQWNTVLFKDSTVTVGTVTNAFDQNKAQGRVRMQVEDSTFTSTGHFEIWSSDNQTTFINSKVVNRGVLRFGTHANASNNILKMQDTEWKLAGREVIVGRLASHTLEIGSGSTFTVESSTGMSDSGNLFLGYGTNGGGHGTLVVSNATLAVEKSIYAPRHVAYGAQYVKIYEDAGSTTKVECNDFYIGASAKYNDMPSKTVRTVAEASQLDMDGGSIACRGTFSIGATYETGGNTFNLQGATAHCTAQTFSVANASVWNVTVPAGGFTAGPLVEAAGTCSISADSRINVDAATENYRSGRVRLVTADEIAVDEEKLGEIFTITPANGCRGRLDVIRRDGKIVEIDCVFTTPGMFIVIR